MPRQYIHVNVHQHSQVHHGKRVVKGHLVSISKRCVGRKLLDLPHAYAVVDRDDAVWWLKLGFFAKPIEGRRSVRSHWHDCQRVYLPKTVYPEELPGGRWTGSMETDDDFTMAVITVHKVDRRLKCSRNL